MKTIGAAKFKEQCLTLLDQLDHDGLVITKHGKPVGRLLPFERQHAEMIGQSAPQDRDPGRHPGHGNRMERGCSILTPNILVFAPGTPSGRRNTG